MNIKESESSRLELKREVPRNNQIVNTVIGFCNLYGGRIIIGVEDNGNIIGVDESKVDGLIESLQQSIYKSISPQVFPKIYSQRYGEVLVLVIDVSEGSSKPYYLNSAPELEKGVFIRLGRSTVKATPDIIQELQWQSSGKYYDETPAYRAKQTDLDEQLIIDFLRNRKHGFGDKIDDKILLSYSLLIHGQTRIFPSVGAILLFGKEPQQYLTESFIICSHFEGASGRKAIASVDCYGNLFQQIDQATEFVFNRLYKSYAIEGLKRNEKLEIPEVAVREVIVNAVVHRNHFINGPIKIAIYEDRLEIFSPGVFPGPLDVNNLEQGITYIRNSVITKVFREAGIIEKLGSGFISLFSSYRESKLQKPTVIEGLNFIKCILPRKMPEIIYDTSVEYPDRVHDVGVDFKSNVSPANNGIPDDELILELFQSTREISMAIVLQKTGWARATAGRRLKKLVDDKKLIKIGAGRYSRYRLAGRNNSRQFKPV